MRAVVLLVVLAMVGCRQPVARPDGRYIVTSAPLQVGLANDVGLCIAVDSRDPNGVWWWEPGPSGCATMSTGPTVLRPDDAEVSRSTESDVITVAFRLQLHARTPTFLDVRLVVEGGRMRTLDSRPGVAVQHREDLNVPWERPRPQ